MVMCAFGHETEVLSKQMMGQVADRKQCVEANFMALNVIFHAAQDGLGDNWISVHFLESETSPNGNIGVLILIIPIGILSPNYQGLLLPVL